MRYQFGTIILTLFAGACSMFFLSLETVQASSHIPCPTPTSVVSDTPATVQFMGIKLGAAKPLQGLNYWLDVILRIIIPYTPPDDGSDPCSKPSSTGPRPTTEPSQPPAPPAVPPYTPLLISDRPDGYMHGIVSAWAGSYTRQRLWHLYPDIDIVMLDRDMEGWQPTGNSYTFDWSKTDADIQYLLSEKRKIAMHVNYDKKNNRFGPEWIYQQLAQKGAPNGGVGGTDLRGGVPVTYPAWYWHQGTNWPWKDMYGWLIKEVAYHLRTTHPGQTAYIRAQLNADDPENIQPASANDPAMAQRATNDYAAWVAKTYYQAFMSEDPNFWSDRDVSKLASDNRIQVMKKPKYGLDAEMKQYGLGVFLTHGAPSASGYEVYEQYSRNQALPGTDETGGGSGMPSGDFFYNQHWYHLMALHSGFTITSMRDGMFQIPRSNRPQLIKDQFATSVAFVKKYLGYIHHPEKSPGAWIAFRWVPDRGTEGHGSAAGGEKALYRGSNEGNWNFHITQAGSPSEIATNSPPDEKIGDLFYGLFTRKLSGQIKLDVSDQFKSGNLDNASITITAHPKNTSQLAMQVWNGNNYDTYTLNFGQLSQWQAKTITAPYASFNHPQKADVILSLLPGNELYIHMVEIE